MPEIKATVDIDAPPERVWQVLTALAQHDEWNPMMSRVRGELRPGGKLDFVVGVDGREFGIAARLVRVDPNRELCWRGPRLPLLGTLVRAEHYFRLEALGTERTRLTHGEVFEGWLVGPIWSRLRAKLEPLYREVAEALAARAAQRSL